MVICENCKKKMEEKNKGKSDEVLFFEKWSDKKYCLEAVKNNGYALRYVKDKTVFQKILKERKSNSSTA